MKLALLVDKAARQAPDRGCPHDVAVRVGDRHPGTRSGIEVEPLHGGAVTILIADVDNATPMIERPGDRSIQPVLSAGGTTLREQIAAHGGIELGPPRMPFAAAFTSARRAVLCAIRMQRTLAGQAADCPQEPMRVRIALHTDSVIREDTDPLGPTWLLATRIARHARGGEIVVSAALKNQIGSVSDLRFGPGRDIVTGGREGCGTVHEVCWAGDGGIPEAARVDEFRREGECWRIAWRGRRRLVGNVRGLHHIARLLRHPGREFHVLDLVGTDVSGTVAARRHEGIAALDAPAKAAYRRRLAELRDELDEAERFCDVGRAAIARAELEELTQQLAAAVGLGGRGRGGLSAAERARSTVTQSIHTALKRVRGELPELADELRLRIKTGVYCVYIPDPTHPMAWVL
jgi:class 3 adenylate cyclase